VIQNARDQAESNLKLQGHRDVYEPAELTYDDLEKKASYSWKDQDIAALNSTTSMSATPTVSYLSPALDDIDDGAWAHATLTSDQVTHAPAPYPFSTSIGKDTPAWWMFDGPSQDAQAHCSSFPDDGVQIDFDVVLAAIQRPWLDLKAIASPAWRWKSPRAKISDGRLDDNIGTSPLMLSYAVVIRNLRIEGSGIKDCRDLVRKASLSKKAVRFGPFSLAATETTGTFFLPPIVTASAIVVPYPQIVAFGVTPLPDSPNPNSDFIWPDQEGK
jgi:hypothetical protein